MWRCKGWEPPPQPDQMHLRCSFHQYAIQDAVFCTKCRLSLLWWSRGLTKSPGI